MSLLQSLLRPPQERAFWAKATVTAASITLALLVRWALDPHLGPKAPFTMLALATLVSALFGGWRHGAFAMVVGGSLAYHLFVRPAGQAFDGGALVTCLVFFTQGVMVCFLSEVLHMVVARSALALRRASQDFQSMAEHAEVLIWFTNQDHNVSFVNRYWLTFTGRTREEAQSDLLAPVHPEDRGRVHATRQEGVRNQRPFQMEYRLLRADGEYRWVLEHAIPRFSPQGAFEGYLGSGNDITRSIRERERLDFITTLQRSLTKSLDFDETATALVESVAPKLADWCSLYLVDDEDILKPVRTHHAPINREGQSGERREADAGLFSELEGATVILKSGEPTLVSKVSDTFLREIATDNEHFQRLRKLQLHSYLGVPLRARDRVIGVLILASAESERVFAADELALTLKIAVIAAYALDNAHLYETTRNALAAEEQARRERYLSEEALERQRLLLKTIIDAVPAMVAYVDTQERFLVHNRQYEKWLGVSYNQVHGKTLREVTGEDVYAAHEGALRQAFRGGNTRFEQKMEGGDQARTIVVTYHPDFDAQHAVCGIVIHAYDITESRQMETAVTRSENRYRTLVSATAAIVWTTDSQGRLTEATGWQAFTGQALQEYVGHGWLSAVHPADRQEVARLWDQACRERSTFDSSYRMRRFDGVYRYIQSRGAAVTDSRGTVQEWIGTITDIHDRVEAQHALALKESELKLIVDAMPALVAYVHRDGTFGRANQAYNKWFGLDPEKMRDRLVSEVVGQEVYTADLSRIDRVLSGHVVHFEEEMAYRFGPPRWISGTYVPHVSEDRHVLGYVALVIDITERKRSERALAEALSRYRFLADAMPQVVWTAGPDGEIEYVNNRWPEITGLSEKDLLQPDGWLTALHPDDRKGAAENWSQAVRSGQPLELSLRMKTVMDGTYRWHLMRALPRCDADGQVEQWVGTATDIDAQRRAYADLAEARELLGDHARHLEDQVRRRTASLQESNAELEAFSYSVSHDLRTPLRFVRGFTEAIIEENGATLPEQTQDYLKRILSAALRMDTIINDLLAYSRLSRAEMKIVEQPLERIVNEVITLQHTQIQQAGAKVVVESPLPLIRADRTGLFQALSNLVSNALKFTAKDRPPLIRIRAETASGSTRVWVEDNGIGIDPKHHEKIFKLFERLHGTSEFPGTGIGLSLVKKAALRMGGSCGVLSEEGKGSRFWIDLPRSAPPTVNPPAALPGEAP